MLLDRFEKKILGEELLGNAQRLRESLWAIHKGLRKAAWKCPITPLQPIGEEAELSSSDMQKRASFHHFLSRATFLFILIKNQRHIEKFLTLSAAAPLIIFYHFIPLVCQTQFSADSPFYISLVQKLGTLLLKLADFPRLSRL
jgi:hypothetical protein